METVFVFDSSYPSVDVALPICDETPHLIVSNRRIEPPPGHKCLQLGEETSFASIFRNFQSLRAARPKTAEVRSIVVAAPRVRAEQLVLNTMYAICISGDISFYDGASFRSKRRSLGKLLKAAVRVLAGSMLGGIRRRLKTIKFNRSVRTMPDYPTREGSLFGLYTSDRSFSLPPDKVILKEDINSIYGNRTRGYYLPAFSNRLQRYEVETTRHRMSNVTLHVETVNGSEVSSLFKDDRILDYPYMLGRARPLSSYAVSSRLRVKTVERGISLLAYTSGYYHWLLEGVPRILDVIDDGFDFDQYPLILPPLAPFQRQLLELLGIEPDRQVITVAEGEWCHVDECIFPTAYFPFGDPDLEDPSGQPDRSLLLRVRERLLERLPPPAPKALASSKRLYISRAAAAKRKFTAEAESAVSAVLKSAGFERVCLEDHPWPAQVQLVAGAEFIVGLHGAGLTNMVFARNAKSLLEFHNPLEARPYFAVMSRELNIQYAYIIGALKGKATNFDNITIDVSEVERAVGQMETMAYQER